MQATSTTPYTWRGNHQFLVVGTGHHEDTLRITSNYRQVEAPLRLTLPTLCITYADMGFANAIGGRQENYPASSAYGPIYFAPPVEIIGKEEIEKRTWIRGARRVAIGPRTTEIEWHAWDTLVIPRLRIDTKDPAPAEIVIPPMHITVDRPLAIAVSQFADGRQIGGIRVEKRHPNWQPEDERRDYDLWVRVTDGATGQPLQEARLNFFRWDSAAGTPYGHGGFRLVEQRYTDGTGAVHAPARAVEDLEAITLDRPGWRAVAKCYRPLPGQPVRFHIRAWRLREDTMPYTWRALDTPDKVVRLTGHAPEEILRRSRLADPSALRPGMHISLPSYTAAYRMEPGDTFEWLAEAFAYDGVEELAKVNGLADPALLDGGVEILLPGWHFFYARPGDTLEHLDAMFGLSPGWARTVGRVHHPDPRLPYTSEVVAVPTRGFVPGHMVRRV